MATPVTIYYESTQNATKEDRKRSLTPSFIDGIIDQDAQRDLAGAVGGKLGEIQDWVKGLFDDPKPVVGSPEAEEFLADRGIGTSPFGDDKYSSTGDLPSNPIGVGEYSGILGLYDKSAPVINTLAFHANIGETHAAQTEITKFPTQAGFEISNHAIRKNRTIEIEAVITNTLLNAVGSRQLNYGLNNSTIVFEALESLVNSGTVCTVSTNLGLYWPVVFTKFRTKQELGMVDSIKFTLHGEEILVQDTLNKTAPKQVIFTPITGSECDKLASEKARDGFLFQCSCSDAIGGTLDKIYGVNPGVSQGTASVQNSLSLPNTSRSTFMLQSLDTDLGRSLINTTSVSQKAVISADLSEDAITESNVPPEVGITDFVLGEDFQVEGRTSVGQAYTVTYKVISYDFTTNKHRYEVHTTDTEVYKPTANVVALANSNAGVHKLHPRNPKSVGASSHEVGTQAFGILPETDSGIIGASKSVSNCLLMGAGDLACEKAQDLVDTGMGKMRESINGVIMNVVNMGGIDGSDSLLGMSLDCVAAEVYGEGVGFEEAGDLLAGDIDDATNRVLSGAANYGGVKAAKAGEFINTSLNWRPHYDAIEVKKSAKLTKVKIGSVMNNVTTGL